MDRYTFRIVGAVVLAPFCYVSLLASFYRFSVNVFTWANGGERTEVLEASASFLTILLGTGIIALIGILLTQNWSTLWNYIREKREELVAREAERKKRRELEHRDP